MIRRLVWLCVLVWASCSVPAVAETRVALVIGNSKYASKPLKNPVNDARLIDATLTELGFKVERIEDATLDDMRYAARTFLKKSQDADIALFYYAGHAAQVRGNNYLAPIDGKIVYEDELESRGLNITEEVVARLDRRGKQGQLSIVVLDACRDNPFQTRNRSMAQGLSDLAVKPEGMLLAFSTRPGDTALDSPDFRNSRYTAHLVEAMRIPGLEVRDVFARVRDAITGETQGGKFTQTPWFHSSVSSSNFCFVRTRNGQCGGVEPPPLVLAKNIQRANAARNLGDDVVGRPSNDPLSIALFYRLVEESDQIKAEDLKRWQEAANSGDAYAMTVLGLHLERNDPMARRMSDLTRPDAVRWLQKAADTGYAPAQYWLGHAYQHGLVSGQRDSEIAKEYYAIGVKAGYSPAQTAYANLIEASDVKGAFSLYQKAAEQGHGGGMGDLALAYLKGRGAPRDIAKAEQWARKLYAAGGSDMSQHLLGYMYANNLITPKDDADRIRLLGFARLKQQSGRFLYGVE